MIVYCDGSGTTGGPAGIAFVAYLDDKALVEGSLPLANATNQQAEILAAAYALDQIDAGQDVTVISDSEYVVRGYMTWLPGWRERGWRTRGTGSPVKNRRHWERLLAAAARHRSVEFKWTRGHVGTEGNERADLLAGEARRRALDDALVAGSA